MNRGEAIMTAARNTETTTAGNSSILFVAEGVSLAHVARPALLARWAAEAGHEVSFACSSRFAWVARCEGLTPIEIETIGDADFYSRLSHGKFFYTVEDIRRYISAEVELMSRLDPDLVVGDFRLTLPVSAWYAGVECLSLANAYWSPVAERRLSPPEAGFFGLLPSGIRETLFSALKPLAYRMFAAPLDRVRKSYGLPAFSDFRQHYTGGDTCGYMDLPSLVPLEQPPSNHFYLGPVIWHPRGLPEPSLSGLGLERPLAYVTMGSSGDRRLLPAICGELLGANCDLAISGIRQEEQEMLLAEVPGLKGRSVLGQFFSPKAALARASFTVCHGGNGTVYQSLEAGVPVVCLPSNPDQSLMSDATEAAGAGIVAQRNSIRRSIDMVLDGRHGSAARRLADAIAGYDTRSRWQAFIAGAEKAPAVVEVEELATVA
ncbi:MAG: hypothetical protein C0404_14595 [Verrucomicrobia bacterium]|nr:hypothetical protein [Verrucomicrobiota bacterium]